MLGAEYEQSFSPSEGAKVVGDVLVQARGVQRGAQNPG